MESYVFSASTGSFASALGYLFVSGLGVNVLKDNPKFLRMARLSIDSTVHFMYFTIARIALVLFLLVVDNGLATFRYYELG